MPKTLEVNIINGRHIASMTSKVRLAATVFDYLRKAYQSLILVFIHSS